MSVEMVVCGACGALNRVPRERLSARPVCGRCGKALFGGKSHPVDGKTFERLVGKSSLPVLVDFWAPWCGPCRAMAPGFEAAAASLEPEVVLAKLDTEAVRDVAARYAIRSIPTLILFRAGHETARHSGALSQQAIVRWVRDALSAA